MLSLKALVTLRVAQFVQRMETTSCIKQSFTRGLKQWKVITISPKSGCGLAYEMFWLLGFEKKCF